MVDRQVDPIVVGNPETPYEEENLVRQPITDDEALVNEPVIATMR